MPRRVLVVGVLLAVLAGACSGSGGETAAPTTAPAATLPPTTTPTTVRATTTTTSTTLKPTTTVTTMLGLGVGDSIIGGTVSGPTGPVDGATVRIERLVGKAVATQDVTTTGGGSWQLVSILGGSYRVRAFRPPDFGVSSVESFFLAAGERKTFDLRLPAAGGERITAVVNPNPPRVDQGATVTVQIGVGRVDDQGRPSLTPRVGVLLTLTPGAGILLDSNPQAVTDGNGSAAWTIRCAVEGARSLTLMIANGTTTINLPPCAAAPAPPAPTTTRPR